MMDCRRASMEDLDPLSILFDQYRVFYDQPSNIDVARYFLKERLQQQEAVIFVAQIKDQLVGFTQCYPSFSSVRLCRMWLLNDLYVKKSYRGRGIGKNLIEKAKQLALETNAGGLYLETEKTNDIGNQLYPTTGFVKNESSNFYEWVSEK